MLYFHVYHSVISVTWRALWRQRSASLGLASCVYKWVHASNKFHSAQLCRSRELGDNSNSRMVISEYSGSFWIKVDDQFSHRFLALCLLLYLLCDTPHHSSYPPANDTLMPRVLALPVAHTAGILFPLLLRHWCCLVVVLVSQSLKWKQLHIIASSIHVLIPWGRAWRLTPYLLLPHLACPPNYNHHWI